MKDRPYGFLSEEKIDSDSEIFDYIKELHQYLWEYINRVIPSASGNLHDYADLGLKILDDNKILIDYEDQIKLVQLRLQIGL
jgi:hypothetical protein